MKVFILAAGMGTRLGAYTKEIPKCLVKINGLPLIYFQKEILDNFKNLKNNIYIIQAIKIIKLILKILRKLLIQNTKVQICFILCFFTNLYYVGVSLFHTAT